MSEGGGGGGGFRSAPGSYSEAARQAPADTSGHRQTKRARAVGGGGSSSVADQAARMLPGRLCLVPLLLALGVGSGGGSGDGGDSRRRRLLAAKGGCWGSLFLFRKEVGQARGCRPCNTHPFLWQLRLLRAPSSKSAP